MLEDDEPYDLPEDSLAPEFEYLPDDIIFIPSDVLYDHSWDNTYVRQKRRDLTQMEDSVEIILSHPDENPFVFPRQGRFLSGYGFRGKRFHAGVDIKLNLGDTIVAAFDGKVRLTKRYKGYGNVVVIRHFNGLETLYSHLVKSLVSVNQDVKAGEPIGLGGRTGRATTTHLHFEARFLGEPFNPAFLIDFETFKLRSDTLLLTAAMFERRKAGRSSRSPQAATITNTSQDEPHTYYRIRKGDTLSAIARKHGTSVQALCRLNKISTRTILRPGRQLKVR